MPLRLELDADARSVALAREAITDVAAAVGADVAAVRMCVSEAVTNAVLHGYRDEPTGVVRVVADLVPVDVLLVRVEDEGSGLAPRPDSPGLGLGLPLIGALAMHAESSSVAPSGARLDMWFRAAG